MDSELIREELIQIDMEATDTDDFFHQMATILLEKGYIKPTFEEAIIKREAIYPTALPIEPFIVAIPHTDCEHIEKAFVAPVRLKNPVKWCEMAANENVHDARFVFVLGIKEAHQQVDLLQVLINNVQDEQMMQQLNVAKDAKEYYQILKTMKLEIE